jgi:stage IV sporulation protein FB
MNEQDDLPQLNVKPGEENKRYASLPRTIISLLFFVVFYYWIFKSWAVVLALIVVLLLHESGHFIAMKFFGYKDINMTFVPFAGAYVSGETGNLSNRNKLIVLLAGPLPGIIIGIVLLFMHHHNQEEVFYLFAIIFLLQNTFNLLPVLPLDGGQFFQALFFNINGMVQLVFFYLLLLLLVFVSFYYDHNWGYMVFSVPLIIKIWRMHFVAKVRKKLDAAEVDYACNYDDLTDDEYWQIRNVVIEESKKLSASFKAGEPSDNEEELIPYVERVLTIPYEDTLTHLQKFIFVLIWVLALVSPLLAWAWHKGTL